MRVDPELSEREYLASERGRKTRALDCDLLWHAGIDVEGSRFWFALRTAQRSEIEIEAALRDSRVDAVVPIKSVPALRRHGVRSAKIIHRPVLRDLVFVNCVPSPRAFAGLLRVRGIAAIIGKGAGKGDQPFPIGDREMSGFMELAQSGAFDERMRPTGIKVGSRVRITTGRSADLEGVLEGYARGRTARVRTLLFGHEMTVDVKLAHLSELD